MFMTITDLTEYMYIQQVATLQLQACLALPISTIVALARSGRQNLGSDQEPRPYGPRSSAAPPAARRQPPPQRRALAVPCRVLLVVGTGGHSNNAG
jgi:hypothetical protein